jgi:threonine/homoserine/homoserine lactone efflux protein
MEALIGAAGAIAAAALTPGPNNFVVMRTAARGGIAAALPAIAGVVLGSLVLLGVVVAGAGAAFDAVPHLRVALTIAGCLYLVYLGVRLLRGGSGGGKERAPARAPQDAQDGKHMENVQAARETSQAAKSQERLPAGVAGLFGFQFLNPKSWVLVLTATAATPAGSGGLARFGGLAVLFAVIPTACLLLWAALGKATAVAATTEPGTAKHERAEAGLERDPRGAAGGRSGRARAWLDRVLGALLIASALLLLVEA